MARGKQKPSKNTFLFKLLVLLCMRCSVGEGVKNRLDANKPAHLNLKYKDTLKIFTAVANFHVITHIFLQKNDIIQMRKLFLLRNNGESHISTIDIVI